MKESARLKIAIQKNGRLAEKSVSLLMKCGLDFDLRRDRLIHKCNDFPIDLLMARDDDIPKYVADGICHLGIAGKNIIQEKYPESTSSSQEDSKSPIQTLQTLMNLGFGHCRLSIAMDEKKQFSGPRDLDGLRIATSYPEILKKYLRQNRIEAEIVELSGSVEMAPGLGIADAICDLISTGATLRSNGLREVTPILESQAVLIRSTKPFDPVLAQQLERLLQRLLQRLNGVIRASISKYIMMNAPRSALGAIRKIIPGMEEPSIMPLGGTDDKIAIHVVARETFFWDTIENLKAAGASSILVLPIEKVIA